MSRKPVPILHTASTISRLTSPAKRLSERHQGRARKADAAPAADSLHRIGTAAGRLHGPSARGRRARAALALIYSQPPSRKRQDRLLYHLLPAAVSNKRARPLAPGAECVECICTVGLDAIRKLQFFRDFPNPPGLECLLFRARCPVNP